MILRLHKGGTGTLKIGKVLGIGTGTVQRVIMEQSRLFDVDVAEAAAFCPSIARYGASRAIPEKGNLSARCDYNLGRADRR